MVSRRLQALFGFPISESPREYSGSRPQRIEKRHHIVPQPCARVALASAGRRAHITVGEARMLFFTLGSRTSRACTRPSKRGFLIETSGSRLTLPTHSVEEKILNPEDFARRFKRHLIEEGLTIGMVEGGALIMPTSSFFRKLIVLTSIAAVMP
jgi:hypothetical protein